MPAWQIRYSEHVRKEDIPKLSSAVRERIRSAIEQKLLRDPLHFGKPLRYSLTGQRSLRVGDWRVLYAIDPERYLISITAIGHRRDIYE